MSADNSSSESPPTLRWKQGEIDGTIPLTKASGVRAALRDAGAIVSDDVIINVKITPLARTNLDNLIRKEVAAADGAEPLSPAYVLELSAPKEKLEILLNVTRGSHSQAVTVRKPATPTSVVASLCTAKLIDGPEKVEGVQLVYDGVCIDLSTAVSEASDTLLATLFPPDPNLVADEQVEVHLPLGENATLKDELLVGGWSLVLTKVQDLKVARALQQHEVATLLGVSDSLISQMLNGTYIIQRKQTLGGAMRDSDAADWAQRLEHAKDGTVPEAVKQKREPRFEAKKLLMGGTGESVHAYLERGRVG